MAPVVTPATALVFGASGALGSVLATKLTDMGVRVMRVSRAAREGEAWITDDVNVWQERIEAKSVDRVVFAHGQNAAGGLSEQSPQQLAELFDANVVSIARWMHQIVESGIAARPCRVCIIGSVWANIARSEKLAYVVTKSAVGGLVRSLNIDLAGSGVVVNAVLPGLIDTQMTREYVSPESIAQVEHDTPGGRLVTPLNVAEVCSWLTSEASTGVSGQSLVVDGGWSSVRAV